MLVKAQPWWFYTSGQSISTPHTFIPTVHDSSMFVHLLSYVFISLLLPDENDLSSLIIFIMLLQS